MKALRRDLVERKLWMVVAALVVAIAAVPMLLLKGASASTTPTVPAPPAATPASTTATTPPAEPTKVVLARIARDPFASGVPKLSSKPSSSTNPSSSGSGTSTSTTSSSTSTTSTVAMVSPTPTPTGSSASNSSGSSSAAGSASPSGSTPTTSTTATTPATPSRTPTSTIASTPPNTQAKVETWTTYSVSVRFGKNLSVPVRTNIARLTAMPSAQQPDVMFMGVMSNGKAAVFALRQGVGHTGPGWCHPDHALCSAIVLKAGQTEDLTIPGPNNTGQKRMLRVVKIGSDITHSRKTALGAFTRVSPAGLCDVLLADPMLYHLDTGTYSNIPKNACAKYPKAVPFSYFRTAP